MSGNVSNLQKRRKRGSERCTVSVKEKERVLIEKCQSPGVHLRWEVADDSWKRYRYVVWSEGEEGRWQFKVPLVCDQGLVVVLLLPPSLRLLLLLVTLCVKPIAMCWLHCRSWRCSNVRIGEWAKKSTEFTAATIQQRKANYWWHAH